MRVGVLTAGGDCPGLNAVIRAVVRKGQRHYQDDIYGFVDGYRGLTDNEWMPLDIDTLRGTLPRGGTILGTSRFNPFRADDGVERIRKTFAENELDAVIAIGGEGSLSCALELHRLGLPMVGVPKTIDNDIGMTERTFGFDTAVAIATEAIDRLHTTAESHNRIMVVEVMGRHVGHIATWAGLAGGATMTLIPEDPFDIDEVCRSLQRRHEKGRYASIVVVAEGARPKEGTIDIEEEVYDEYGHVRLGGIANRVAHEIEARTGMETRVTILGHVQRGGSPTA
ncbi:MAG: ATP-dependent 6-phosphofructokinase, partial [Actinomycetota bacterium]